MKKTVVVAACGLSVADTVAAIMLVRGTAVRVGRRTRICALLLGYYRRAVHSLRAPRIFRARGFAGTRDLGGSRRAEEVLRAYPRRARRRRLRRRSRWDGRW